MTTIDEIKNMAEWLSAKLVLRGLDYESHEEGVWAYDVTISRDDLARIVKDDEGMFKYITDDGDVFYDWIDNVQTIMLKNEKTPELKRS